VLYQQFCQAAHSDTACADEMKPFAHYADGIIDVHSLAFPEGMAYTTALCLCVTNFYI